MVRGVVSALCAVLVLSGCGDMDNGNDVSDTALADPGSSAWMPVPAAQVAQRCGLDPALLSVADVTLNRPYAVIRFGQLCHEFYPEGADSVEEVFSTTKTLGALVTGIAAYETRNLPRRGPKTGPLSDEDRVDYWLDRFRFNPDAHVAHVLAMVAQSRDLSFGHKVFQYDLVGQVQINRLSDIVNAALQQDTEHLGHDLEEFTNRFLYGPLGMHDSTWSNRAPDKIFAYSWHTTVRDMARVGLLMLHDGVWSGQRILEAAWTYKMTHVSFEDANTAYGYLTWLNSNSNYPGATRVGPKQQGPVVPCAPVALWPHYPHGLSEALDCNYEPPYTCQQTFDVGLWYAAGLKGQYIIGHRGLDLLLVVKNLGDTASAGQLWDAIRPALVALDPVYKGDEAAFCADYSRNAYAPNRH